MFKSLMKSTGHLRMTGLDSFSTPFILFLLNIVGGVVGTVLSRACLNPIGLLEWCLFTLYAKLSRGCCYKSLS